MKLIILNLCFFLSFSTFGLTIAKKELKDTLSLNGKSLVLNGAGIRKATIFNVKVYVAGLYTKSKSNDGNGLINSEDSKYIVMHFLRDLEKGKISGAWTEAFDNNKSINPDYSESLNKLNSLMQDMKKNEVMEFWFDKNKVSVSIRNKKVGEISGKNIDKLLLSAWLGNPIDKQLKEGLLGKK